MVENTLGDIFYKPLVAVHCVYDLGAVGEKAQPVRF